MKKPSPSGRPGTPIGLVKRGVVPSALAKPRDSKTAAADAPAPTQRARRLRDRLLFNDIARDVLPGMENAQNNDVVCIGGVKDNVLANNEAADVGTDLGAMPSEVREVDQSGTGVVKSNHVCITIGATPRLDRMLKNAAKIASGAGGKAKPTV